MTHSQKFTADTALTERQSALDQMEAQSPQLKTFCFSYGGMPHQN